jgi:uncharacterized protein with PQ loop repeat
MTVVLWKDKEKIGLRYFEPFMMAMGILGPLATAPQLVKLYFTHSQHAEGLSLSMWVAYTVLSVLWVIYGLVHRTPPIWIGNMLGFGMDAAMVVGILIHAGVTF